MIVLPRTVAEAGAASGQVRAGGTDLTELRHRGIRSGDLVDLRDVTSLSGVEPQPDGGLRIGALVTVDRIATDPLVRAGWPALAAAAGALATPQIRARATLGGSLLQEVRCWYFRSPEFNCLKKGGATCHARGGDATFHALVDLGPCIAPHPSTLAAALLAHDAVVELDGQPNRTIPGLLGDGSDPRKTHALGQGELLTAAVLPPAVPGERGGYHRAISRARAEWPLVEAVVRVALDVDGKFAFLAVALGGIANRPRSYPDLGRAAVGLAPDDPRLEDLLRSAVPRTFPLPQATYKSVLIAPTIREALDRALASEVS